MNVQKQCLVILDLLPLYQEGLLRPETEQAVSAHLQECADCRRAYAELHDGMLPDVPNTDRHTENLRQAAPLQKFRFRLWMNLLGAPLWLPLLLAGALLTLAVLAALFSVLAALWCVPISGLALSLAGIFVSVCSALDGLHRNALFLTGASLAYAGLSVFCFWLCKELSGLFFRAIKWLAKAIGSRFRRSSRHQKKKKGDTVQ